MASKQVNDKRQAWLIAQIIIQESIPDVPGFTGSKQLNDLWERYLRNGGV